MINLRKDSRWILLIGMIVGIGSLSWGIVLMSGRNLPRAALAGQKRPGQGFIVYPRKAYDGIIVRPVFFQWTARTDEEDYPKEGFHVGPQS